LTDSTVGHVVVRFAFARFEPSELLNALDGTKPARAATRARDNAGRRLRDLLCAVVLERQELPELLGVRAPRTAIAQCSVGHACVGRTVRRLACIDASVGDRGIGRLARIDAGIDDRGIGRDKHPLVLTAAKKRHRYDDAERSER
jgi:hypothetical protein